MLSNLNKFCFQDRTKLSSYNLRRRKDVEVIDINEYVASYYS